MLVVFLILVAASIWFIAPWGQFPLNDDWVYTKNVLETLSVGKFTVSAGQYAYAIPQVVLGLFVVKPDQDPFLKLRWLGIATGIVAASFLAWLGQKSLKQKSSILFLLGAISIFFFIPYFQPTFSFMTDAPAFLLWVISVWTLGLFLEKKNFNCWLLAFLTNALAVSERQLAILIPFSIVLSQNVGFRPKQGLHGLARVFKQSYPVMLFVIPLVLIQLWWSQISPVKVPASSFSPNPGVLVRLSRQLIYLGWTMIPFLCIPVNRSIASPNSTKFFKRALIVFVLGLVLHVVNWGFFGSYLLPPFYGNVLDRVGILPVLLAGNPEIIFPNFFRWGLLVVGIGGALRILWGFSLILDDSSKNKGIQLILSSSLVYSIFICFRGTQFDRYFIPVLPLSLICILKTCSSEKLSQLRVAGTGLACFVYIAFATTLVSDYFRWNEARRAAIDFVFSKGLRPKDVCAGYEHEGWYQTDSKDCSYLVSFSELPKYKTEQKFSYSSFWGSRQRDLYLLRKEAL